MTYFLTAIIALAAVFYFQPNLLVKIPLPQDPIFEDRLVGHYLKDCKQNLPQLISENITSTEGLSPQQYQALLHNPHFQGAFCQCQGEIIKHERMVPSAYLPKALTQPLVRDLASTVKSHLASTEGHRQINYCFVHAWTKASFAP